MITRWLRTIFYLLFIASCSTVHKKSIVKQADFFVDRSVAGSIRCEDLFNNARINIIDRQDFTDHRNDLQTKVFHLIDDVLPKSTNEFFWKIVEQTAQNGDTKINLSTDKMNLTQKINNDFKIHSTYNYDPERNEFVLKKIEYTEKDHDTKTLSTEPLYDNSTLLKSNLSLKIEEFNDSKEIYNIFVLSSIPYDAYIKFKNEIKNLSFFTTYELLKLSKFTPKIRLAKYQTMLAGRKIKKFIINDFMEELIKAPIKMAVISVFSVVAMTHADFLKNIVSVKQVTPAWVAPSIVKMAGRYPTETQSEIVLLMKTVNKNTEEIKFFKTELEVEKKLVNIDDIDQFTFQRDSVHEKTYFMMSHENQEGNTDIYSLEIDPVRFPHLAARSDAAQAEAPRPTPNEKEILDRNSKSDKTKTELQK